MVRFNGRRSGAIGAVITALGITIYTLGYGAGETGAILSATFGDQYTVRLTCDGGRAFSQYIHGFSREHAGGKMEKRHPGCRAATVTPVRHHRRAGTYSTGIRV